MKKILFAASEAVPFMKTGGLADVTGSLPKYFDKKNYDVRVILPKYVCMEERWKGQLHFLCHFYVNLSWRKQYVGIFETTYDGITYYLVDKMCIRDSPSTGRDTFFCRRVLLSAFPSL